MRDKEKFGERERRQSERREEQERRNLSKRSRSVDGWDVGIVELERRRLDQHGLTGCEVVSRSVKR